MAAVEANIVGTPMSHVCSEYYCCSILFFLLVRVGQFLTWSVVPCLWRICSVLREEARAVDDEHAWDTHACFVHLFVPGMSF